ncbi:MAG TPA: sigma 54-interacting transcriptional regulator [Polyangiaceae bacterium]
MRSEPGSTTVTERSSPRSTARFAELGLVWVFPNPSESWVDLLMEGERERSIGREEGSAIRLSGDGVSRRHAVLRRDPATGVIAIADQGSRNGIRVNGRPVTLAPLAAGDVVRLGGWVGVVTGAPGSFCELAPGLFGGKALEAALSPLKRAASSDLPIVLEGETGTGKEIVAESLHHWSGRSGPLVAVNCATLPHGLAEAELFGYRRGAFTGADRSSPGFFRSAEGGTLLLDEVSDLPLGVQAKLLRVLEQRAVQPLGETRPAPVDVRIVVAGQQSLADAVKEGRFRADLLARLDGLEVRLPPLRKRREDVLPLFSRFLGRLSGGRAPALDVEFVERLVVHDWPFNVRELVLLVRRLLVLHGAETTLSLEHLSERMLETPEANAAVPEAVKAGPAPSTPQPDGVELPALITALRASGGNVARASALLGISRQRAYRLMEAAGVDLRAVREGEGP